MNLKNRICPYCGKDLHLTVPSQKYLPNAIGRDNWGRLFITHSTVRDKSYDLVPSSMGGDIVGGRRFYETNEDGGMVNGTAKKLIKDLEADMKMKSIHRDIPYQCSNCHNIVAVNRSAAVAAKTLGIFSPLPPLEELAVVLFAPGIEIVVTTSCLMVLLMFLIVFWNIILNTVYDHRENNFAPVTEFDSLVPLPSLLTLDIKKLPKGFRRKCNILTTSINGERYALYITDVTNTSVRVFICGTGNEAESLVSIIEERRKTEKKPLIDLYFRGKIVGQAEITGIHEITEDYIQPTTLVLPDSSVWLCKRCGYENTSTASQCRSCGEYK